MYLANLSIFLLLIVHFSHLKVNTQTTLSALGSENNDNVNTLGFLVKEKTIKLAINTKIQSVRIKANIGFTLPEVAEDLRTTNSKIQSLLTMTFASDLSDEGKFVNRHINSIQKEYNKLNTEISEILGYSGPIQPSRKSYFCELTLNGLKKDFIQAFRADVLNTVNSIQLGATKAQLLTENNGFGYKDLLNNIFRLRKTLTDFRREILQYAHLLDMLTARRFNPDIVWYLQTLGCVENFEEESYTLKKCDKTTQGIECIVELTVDKEFKILDLYAPVSYNFYQLKLNPNTFIVREDGRWGYLHCKREIEQEETIDMDTCSFSPDSGSCLSILDKHNYEDIRKNCEFEFKTPKQTVYTNEGLLVQSKDLIIREKEGDRIRVLDNNVPYLIKTNNRVLISGHGVEKSFDPKESQPVRQIVRTFLTDQQINSLTTLQRIQNLDVVHIYSEFHMYIGLSIATILVVIIMIVCKCKWKVIQQRIALRHQEQESARIRNRNYRINRNFIRSTQV